MAVPEAEAGVLRALLGLGVARKAVRGRDAVAVLEHDLGQVLVADLANLDQGAIGGALRGLAAPGRAMQLPVAHGDELAQRQRRVDAAGRLAVVVLAELPELRSIDPVQLDDLAVDLQRVAVDHLRRPAAAETPARTGPQRSRRAARPGSPGPGTAAENGAEKVASSWPIRRARRLDPSQASPRLCHSHDLPDFLSSVAEDKCAAKAGKGGAEARRSTRSTAGRGARPGLTGGRELLESGSGA